MPTENPTGSYRREFLMPEDWAERRIFLRFDGVDSAFHVWVNGKEAGFSKGSRIPAEFDITPLVRPGRNVLAADAAWAPHGHEVAWTQFLLPVKAPPVLPAIVSSMPFVNLAEEGNLIRVWTAGLDELYTPYIMPQENGNRTDVRWVALSDGRGPGFMAIGMPDINFTAHRFTTQDLDKARHTFELIPRDNITLTLDYRHNGIGSNSCGPKPWKQYQLKPEEFRFAICLRPFQADGISAADLAKRGVERIVRTGSALAPRSPARWVVDIHGRPPAFALVRR